MSKKTKSKTVTTPTNPEWVTSGIQNSFNKIGELGATDPYKYVPGADPLQVEAGNAAAALGSDDQWYKDLMGSSAPTVQAASLLDGLDKYMSPYTQSVVDAALADFDFGAGQTRAQQALDMAGGRAFGGSGAALTRSMTEDALTRGRASTSANLRDQAFQAGTNLSGQDAARRQSASESNAQMALQHQQFLADLGFRKGESDRANIETQIQAGGTLRDIAAAQARAPLDLAQWTAAAQSGLPLQLFHGETSTTKTKSSDPLGAFTSVLGGVGSILSVPLGGTIGGKLFRV